MTVHGPLQIVNPQVTRWYHCISNTVRGAHLLKNPQDRPCFKLSCHFDRSRGDR